MKQELTLDAFIQRFDFISVKKMDDRPLDNIDLELLYSHFIRFPEIYGAGEDLLYNIEFEDFFITAGTLDDACTALCDDYPDIDRILGESDIDHWTRVLAVINRDSDRTLVYENFAHNKFIFTCVG